MSFKYEMNNGEKRERERVRKKETDAIMNTGEERKNKKGKMDNQLWTQRAKFDESY